MFLDEKSVLWAHNTVMLLTIPDSVMPYKGTWMFRRNVHIFLGIAYSFTLLKVMIA
jgi:hypothetical protein